MSVLVSDICGGLGNAMFMTLVGKTLANKTDRVFAQLLTEPLWSQRTNDYKYFNFLNNNGLILQCLPPNTVSISEQDVGGFDNLLNKILEIPNETNIHVSGYFNDKIYFDKKVFDELFLVNDEFKQKIISHYGITDDMVHVCCRRGDYVRLGVALDFSWYDEILKKYFPGKKLAINSEDLDWCIEKFKNYHYILLQNSENPIETMIAGSCFKNHVLSNSTFAFWQGYFSEPNEKVICPSSWKYNVDGWIGVEEIFENKLRKN